MPSHLPFIWRRFLFIMVLLCSVTASAWSQEWTGKINGIDAYIPDVSKPVRAAMVNSLAFEDSDWRAVARKYNCLMLQIVLNHWECPENAKKIVATLNQASKDFPNHPEIQYTCVSLFGWSQTSAGACRVASQPELADRVLAVVAIHEIDNHPWLPPLSVPHLFISAAGDRFSELKVDTENAKYSHDAAVRDRATDEGAPITMVADVNHSHTDVYNNYAFTRVWLEEVFDRRLPSVPPATAQVVMPDWRYRDGWLGTYDVVEKTHTSPWGNEQRLINVAIAPRAKYKDSRKFLWLPSERCARVWRIYSTNGIMPVYGTLKLPDLVAPTITIQPRSLTILAGQKYAFTATVAGTPPITYQWWRVKGNARKLISSMPNCFNHWDKTTDEDYGATFHLVASNPAGSVTSDEATLTLSTTGTTAPAILVQPLPFTVVAGQTAAFKVQAQGSPAPTFQWQKNGVDIPGATAATYITPAIAAADNNATFRAVAANGAGSVFSDTAILTVNVSPSIKVQPQDAVADVGQTAEFSVKATGLPEPSYQWRKNDVDIPSVKNSANRDHYTTPLTTASDNGAIYTVAVSNGIGSSITSAAATLKVNPPADPKPGTQP